jgi:tetratricopeptide (TPR) repeat protein
VTGADRAPRPQPAEPTTAARFRDGHDNRGDAACITTETLNTRYDALTPPLQQAYRVFGLHPRTALATPALAAALNVPAETAQDLINGLVTAALITPAEPGTGWIMHVRVWSHAQRRPEHPEIPSTVISGRLSDYYLAAARCAARTIMPARGLAPSPVDELSFAMPGFGGLDYVASIWLAENWDTLVAFLDRTDADHLATAIAYLDALTVGWILHRPESSALPVYERLLGYLLAGPVLDVAAVLRLATGAAREAIRVGRYDDAIAYADSTEDLALLAGDDLAASSVCGTRGRVHLHRGEFWKAAGQFSQQLDMLTTLAELPGPDGSRPLSRNIAQCRINLSLAENEIGESRSALAHAEQAERLLMGLPHRDSFDFARAWTALAAATIATGIGENIQTRLELLGLVSQARDVFASFHAVREEASALRMIAALIEPLLSQVRADTERCRQAATDAQTRTTRYSDGADRIETLLKKAVAKTPGQPPTPSAAAP